MENHTTVVLADDHAIVRQGIKLFLEQDPTIRILGEAADGNEAIQLVQRLKPDVLVCDIAMPGLSGVEVVKRITGQPGATKILFLTMQDKEEYILEAMRAGAMGFLPKATVGEELLQAIRQVAQGREYFSKLVYEKAFKALRSLHQREEIRTTPRENEILQLLAQGLNNRLIAEKLFVSEYTVANHRANLLRKFSATNVVELVRKAMDLNLIKT